MLNHFFEKSILLLLIIFISQTALADIARLRCMWREDPTTTMVIGWDQTAGDNPIFYYSTHQLQGQPFKSYALPQTPDKVLQTKGMNNHFVRLRGLSPETRYYFKIIDNLGESKTYSFETAPASPYTRLSIIAGGDSRNHREGRINANKLVGKLRPHFVLFGGDMTGADNDRQWVNWFNDWQHTITEDGRLTPIVVTRGNHEYSNKTLIDLFDVNTIDLFYAFTFGTNLLRVYTLNSLIPSGGKQKMWLEKDLQRTNFVQWKIAQYHHTIRPHTRGKPEKHEQLKNWATLFYKYQVQLVVESDAHVVKTTYPIKPSKGLKSYEGFVRDDEKGTIYIGEGCWGAPLRDNNDTKPWTRASGSFNQFKWIFLDMNGIEVRTIKTDNADMVAAVPPNNQFAPPTALDVWAPNGEPIIYIPNKGMASPVSYTGSIAAKSAGQGLEIKNFLSSINGQDIEVKWLAKGEPSNLYYELQRSLGNGKYVPIVRMQGKSHSNDKNPTYRYKDEGLAMRAQGKYIKYRLKYILPSGQTYYYHPPIPKLTEPENKSSKQSTALETDKNGRIQVKYQLEQNGAVSFQLFNAVDRQEVFHNRLINQPPKSYLKSLDISQLPKGQYVLVVKSNKDEIERFRVLHK